MTNTMDWPKPDRRERESRFSLSARLSGISPTSITATMQPVEREKQNADLRVGRLQADLQV
jgi:hypothetical protein